MKNNNKYLKLFYLSLLILVCFIFQTMAYSAINSTMTIKGDAFARAVKDIRVTNFKLNSSSVNATSYYEEFGVDTISTKFYLENSSSSIVFDVEVTNYGSLEVGILQLVGAVPTGLSYEIINYNLKDKLCDDTGKCNQMAVKTFQIKFTGTSGTYELTQELDFRTYHKVTYTDIENKSYPTEIIDGGTFSITFKEDLKKVSILSDGVEISYYDKITNGQTIIVNNVFGEIEIKQKAELIKVVSGDIDTPGSEICVEKECFYVVSSTNDTVTMLAKYNLYVGKSVDKDWYPVELSNPTGKQDSTAIGYNYNELQGMEQMPFIGTTAFATSNVSYDTSKIKSYVDNYKTYINSLGLNDVQMRLIRKEELNDLSCDLSRNRCTDADEWVWSTSYWTMTSEQSGYYWTVNNMGDAGQAYYSDDCFYGVRPVIEIPKWMFGESFEFTIDGVTYEAKDGMTWGDWVNSSYDTRGFVNNYDLIYTDDLMYALVYQVDYGTFISHSWPYIDDLIDPNLVYVTFYEAGEDGEW